MFRFEEEIEEQSNQQQNWNLGLNELEWRRMRSSLSSSSISFSTSTSSVGSSAGASSSVMEWANSEDSDQIGAPLGFSLLIYAWRRWNQHTIATKLQEIVHLHYIRLIASPKILCLICYHQGYEWNFSFGFCWVNLENLGRRGTKVAMGSVSFSCLNGDK